MKGWTRLHFYFRSDPQEHDHYIGYLPEYEKPYWVGDCDIPGGCEFEAAKELFEAKIFDGKSIRERWNEVVITNIGGIDADAWKKEWL